MHFRVCLVATLLAAAHADDLVAALKHDLQQDNDDYTELRRARALTSPPRSSPPPSNTPTAPPSSAPMASSTPLASSAALASAAPLVSATPEPVPKFLIPVEKQPHFDESPPAALRRATFLNDSAVGALEVVKVASWYTSLTTQRPKIIDPDPIIAEISVAVNGIAPIIAKKSAHVNYFEPKNAKKTVAESGIAPRSAKKSVGMNGIEPKIAKTSVDVNGIGPVIVKKTVDRNGIGPLIRKKSVVVKGIRPIIATQSAVVKTLTTFRARMHPAFRVRARPAFNPRANELAPRERFLRGKGVEKSLGIDSEYYKVLDDLVKLGRVTKAAAARARGPVMRASASWKKREWIRHKNRQREARGRGRGRWSGHKRVRGAGGAAAVDAELPAAEVLDMAPARGARVYSKRLRHRLCSRSVLNPEGPKYNSQGQVYLQQFAPRGQGHFGFNQTRAPRLLLPRCCNCCRKSVLGCE